MLILLCHANSWRAQFTIFVNLWNVDREIDNRWIDKQNVNRIYYRNPGFFWEGLGLFVCFVLLLRWGRILCRPNSSLISIQPLFGVTFPTLYICGLRQSARTPRKRSPRKANQWQSLLALCLNPKPLDYAFHMYFDLIKLSLWWERKVI